MLILIQMSLLWSNDAQLQLMIFATNCQDCHLEGATYSGFYAEKVELLLASVWECQTLCHLDSGCSMFTWHRNSTTNYPHLCVLFRQEVNKQTYMDCQDCVRSESGVSTYCRLERIYIT